MDRRIREGNNSASSDGKCDDAMMHANGERKKGKPVLCVTPSMVSFLPPPGIAMEEALKPVLLENNLDKRTYELAGAVTKKNCMQLRKGRPAERAPAY